MSAVCKNPKSNSLVTIHPAAGWKRCPPEPAEPHGSALSGCRPPEPDLVCPGGRSGPDAWIAEDRSNLHRGSSNLTRGRRCPHSPKGRTRPAGPARSDFMPTRVKAYALRRRRRISVQPPNAIPPRASSTSVPGPGCGWGVPSDAQPVCRQERTKAAEED